MRFPAPPFLAFAAAVAAAALPFTQDEFMLANELPVDFDELSALAAKLQRTEIPAAASPTAKHRRPRSKLAGAMRCWGCVRTQTSADHENDVDFDLPPVQPPSIDPAADEFAAVLLGGDPQALYQLVECPVCLECMGGQPFEVTLCGHAMHRKCLESSVASLGDFCPSCETRGVWNSMSDTNLMEESHRKKKYLMEIYGFLASRGWIPSASDVAGVLVPAPKVSELHVAEEVELWLRLERARRKTWEEFMKARLKTNIDLVEIIIMDIAEAFFLIEDAEGDGNGESPELSDGELPEPADDESPEPSDGQFPEPADDRPAEPNYAFPVRPFPCLPVPLPVWLPSLDARAGDIDQWLHVNARGARMLRSLPTPPPPGSMLEDLAGTEANGAFLARARFMNWVLGMMHNLAVDILPPGIEIPAVDFARRLRDVNVPYTLIDLLVYDRANGYFNHQGFSAPFRIPRAAVDWLSSMAETLCDGLRDELTRSNLRADWRLWRARIEKLRQMLLVLVFSAVQNDGYHRLRTYSLHRGQLQLILELPPPMDEEFWEGYNEEGSRARFLVALESAGVLHWQ